jgi:hypothetical protein
MVVSSNKPWPAPSNSSDVDRDKTSISVFESVSFGNFGG